MIIVISNPTPVEQEHHHINSLFDAGVSIFHLRKPDYSFKAVAALLHKIDNRHHSKIALHQHHELAVEYGIKRFHYPETMRAERFKDKNPNQHLNDVSLKGDIKSRMICSTSIHATKTYPLLTDFEYCFLSPLFKSISKHTAQALLSAGFTFPEKTATKLIALGGICPETLDKVKAYPFDGIALLGWIWNVPQHALRNYKKINQQWDS